jgi:hypothetical protein
MATIKASACTCVRSRSLAFAEIHFHFARCIGIAARLHTTPAARFLAVRVGDRGANACTRASKEGRRRLLTACSAGAVRGPRGLSRVAIRIRSAQLSGVQQAGRQLDSMCHMTEKAAIRTVRN